MVLEVEFIDFRKIALNPDNPRIDIHNLDLQESLNEYGLQQPIIIRPAEEADDGDIPKGCSHVVIDGDCRLDSLRIFPPDDPLLEVGRDVIIKNLTREKAFIITIQANFMRKDFTLKEEVGLVDDLKKRGFSLREIEKLIRKSTRWVRDRQAIMKLDDEIVIKLYDKKITISEALGRSVLINTPLEVSSRQDSQASSLAGKLVQEGVVRETIAIEGPEEKPITKPPKYLCPTQFFDKLQETFPDVKFLDIKMVGAFTGFNIESEDAETKTKIINLMHSLNQEAKQEAQFEKSKASEEHRTTRFTEDQFRAIEIVSEFEDEIHSYQIIGNEISIIWKSFKSKMDALKWILDHKADFPLTRWQLEKYTDLSQDAIQVLVEASIQQEAEERVKEKPKGPVKNAFAYISKQEYDSLLPSIKALITCEEPTEDGRIQVYFSSWEDESTMSRWLKPSREHLEAILQFPASTFMSTNLKDILIDDKQLKKHFPNVYQELKQLQNFCKNTKQVSLRSMEEITKAAKRLEVFMREIDLDLQHLKRTRRISGSDEQHLKICQKCLQPKWMISKRDLCGNCITSNNKQNKKIAAASSSGGQQ